MRGRRPERFPRMARATKNLSGALMVLVSGCGEASASPTTPVVTTPSSIAAAELSAPETSPRASERARFVDPVRDALSGTGSVQWVVSSQLETGGCIDAPLAGRVARAGEDVGELALALGALERVTGREVSDETIASFVSRRADVAPLHVHDGCRHVQALRAHPEEYGVRGALTDAIVGAIDRLALQHPERVIHETHPVLDDTALVEVVLGATIDADTDVPLLASVVAGDTQLWVAHPELGPRVHEGLARFTVTEAEALGVRVDSSALAHALDALAEQDARATLRHLAREVPVYELRFRQEGNDRVPVLSGPDASLGCRTY